MNATTRRQSLGANNAPVPTPLPVTEDEQRLRARQWAMLQEEKKKRKREAEAEAAGATASEAEATPSKRGRPARKSVIPTIVDDHAPVADDMSIASGSTVSIADGGARKTRRQSLNSGELPLPVIPEEPKPKRTSRRSSLGPGAKPDDDAVSVSSAVTSSTAASVTGTRRSSRLSLSGNAIAVPIPAPAPAPVPEKPSRIPRASTAVPAPTAPLVTVPIISEKSPNKSPEPKPVAAPAPSPVAVEVPPLPQQPAAAPPAVPVAVEAPAAAAPSPSKPATADPEVESLPADEHTADQLAIQASLEQCFRAVGVAGVAVGLCVDYSLWLTIVFIFITVALLRRLGQALFTGCCCNSDEEQEKHEE